MVKKSAAFPSRYLNADGVPGGGPVRAVIKAVTYETVGNDDKWVMHFDDNRLKPLPLNRTNFEACEEAFGSDDSDDWIGKTIEIRVEKVRDLKGKLVPGVRLYAVPHPGLTVRVVPNAKARQEAPPDEPTPPLSAYDDADRDPDDEAA